MAGQISNGRGTLGKLAKDPAAYDQLNRSLANLEAITTRINSGEGALGRLLRDEQMGKSLNSISANMDSLTGRLNRGEGTAGKLLTDAELYDRFNRIAGSLENILVDRKVCASKNLEKIPIFSKASNLTPTECDIGFKCGRTSFT